MIYRVAVVGMVFFGSIAALQTVWSLADLFMGLMVLTNLIAISFLSKFAYAALVDYMKQKKQGKDPVSLQALSLAYKIQSAGMDRM